MFMLEEKVKENPAIKEVCQFNSVEERMGLGVFHMLRALYKRELKKEERFRAASLEPVMSPNTGAWRYTQIYIGLNEEQSAFQAFDLQPKRAVIIAENDDYQELTLTYLLNDVSHIAPGADRIHYYDFDQAVTRAAFFLLRGRVMNQADVIYQVLMENGSLQ